MTPADLERRFTFDEAYERHETGYLDSSAYFGALRRRLKVSLSEEDLVAGWNDVYLGIIPGMEKLLATAGLHFPLLHVSKFEPHSSVCLVHSVCRRVIDLHDDLRLLRIGSSKA